MALALALGSLLGLLLSLGLHLSLWWFVLLKVAALPCVSASILACVNVCTLEAQTRPQIELILWYRLHSS